MTFAVSAALEQETIGVRMEFLAKSDAIRADALNRLERGANPIAVAQTLTDGTTFIDVFGEDINSFEIKLNAVLGHGQGAAYDQVVNGLAPQHQDTPANREHVLRFWQRAIANPALAGQIRAVFIQALQAAQAPVGAVPVQVRWGQPQVTGGQPGSAAYTPAGEVLLTVDPGI